MTTRLVRDVELYSLLNVNPQPYEHVALYVYCIRKHGTIAKAFVDLFVENMHF